MTCEPTVRAFYTALTGTGIAPILKLFAAHAVHRFYGVNAQTFPFAGEFRGTLALTDRFASLKDSWTIAAVRTYDEAFDVDRAALRVEMDAEGHTGRTVRSSSMHFFVVEDRRIREYDVFLHSLRARAAATQPGAIHVP